MKGHIFRIAILLQSMMSNYAFLEDENRNRWGEETHFIEPAEPVDHRPMIHLNGSEPIRSNIVENCQAFFNLYKKYASAFSDCELTYAQPFRMCHSCIEEYVMAKATYNQLVTSKYLEECRIRYLKSDRVQIIPMVQRSIEKIWSTADCAGCYTNLTVNYTTQHVTFDTPKSIDRFLAMYDTLSCCLNYSLDSGTMLSHKPFDKYKLDYCADCNQNYSDLNDHYNDIADEFDGNICMDIVDRMNYTRLIWSYQFNCSDPTAEPGSIITIACIVACTPVLFYITVRVTGKQNKKTLVKQKRLNSTLVKSGQRSTSILSSLWRPNSYQDYQSLRPTSS